MIFSRTAAFLTAAALSELYPGVELRDSKDTSFGFSSDFFFPHPIGAEMVAQVEEKMRQIVREHRPIQTLEMVPESARGLLPHVSMPRRGLVHVAQIGDLYALVDGPLLKNSAEVGAFKLLSLEQGLRIVGVARQSKAELKRFLRAWREYPKVRHEVIGEMHGLWQVHKEGVLWLPKGLKARRKFIDWLQEQLGGTWVECPPGMKLTGPEMGEIVVETTPYDSEKGLFEGGRQTLLRISHLQTVRKTLMMLGFSEEMKDLLLRSWRTFSIEKGMLSLSVERNLALLIERDHCKGMIFEN